MTADSAPIANTPDRCPPCSRLLVSVSLLCQELGSCSSYNPNIDSDSSTKSAEKLPSTQGV